MWKTEKKHVSLVRLCLAQARVALITKYTVGGMPDHAIKHHQSDRERQRERIVSRGAAWPGAALTGLLKAEDESEVIRECTANDHIRLLRECEL